MNPLDEIILLRDALRDCALAMKKSETVGCTDHLDCCDDGGDFWYDALGRANATLTGIPFTSRAQERAAENRSPR